MSLERQTDIQRVIEQRVTNGIGFGRIYHTSQNAVSLQAHLGYLQLRFSRNPAIDTELRAIKWAEEYFGLGVVPVLSPSRRKAAVALIEQFTVAKQKFDMQQKINCLLVRFAPRVIDTPMGLRMEPKPFSIRSFLKPRRRSVGDIALRAFALS